tara:strand:+ start:975 stop:1289 length:315 start_codon:yes stop_codon:yes gene_type:complete
MLPENQHCYSVEDAVATVMRDCTSKQGVRMAQYLAPRQQGVLTGELAAAIACGNLSAAAAKVRPHPEALGWTITCAPPPRRSLNRFGEVSQANLWRLSPLQDRR